MESNIVMYKNVLHSSYFIDKLILKFIILINDACHNINMQWWILFLGLMKFFGGLARFYPKEVCGKFNKFTHTVFENVDGSDISLQGVAIDTVGFIGSTVEGKLALEKLGLSYILYSIYIKGFLAAFD